MSCSTCHKQELAFTDGRAQPFGITGEKHPRSAPSLANVTYQATLGWIDPQPASLERQALSPLLSTHPVELGLKGHEAHTLVGLRTNTIYTRLFTRAFPNARDPFTINNIAIALAAFERTIVSARSPYDRYIYRGEENAISASAKRGELLFFNDGTAGCYRCHSGPNFNQPALAANQSTASRFRNTGLYNLPGLFSYPIDNLGLFEVTKVAKDVGRFRIPSLRNVALTAPYMHDGSVATLRDVLAHYEAGGRTLSGGPHAGIGNKNPYRDPLVQRFALTQQNRADLIAFLNALTDQDLLHDERWSDPWRRQKASLQ